MDFCLFFAVAGCIGLTCHWVVKRLGGPSGYARFILVSIASSLGTAGLFFLYNYVRLGELPEPPGVPIFMAILSFPITLAAGAPFLADGHRVLPGHCRKCGYDLTGNVSGVCPECGTKRDSS